VYTTYIDFVAVTASVGLLSTSQAASKKPSF
jgi:hypothetical protein